MDEIESPIWSVLRNKYLFKYILSSLYDVVVFGRAFHAGYEIKKQHRDNTLTHCYINKVKKYNQVRDIEWMIHNNYLGILLDKLLHNKYIYLNERSGPIKVVKDLPLLKSINNNSNSNNNNNIEKIFQLIYNKFQIQFYHNDLLFEAAKGGNLGIFKALLKQSEPRTLVMTPDVWYSAVIDSPTIEIIKYMVEQSSIDKRFDLSILNTPTASTKTLQTKHHLQHSRINIEYLLKHRLDIFNLLFKLPFHILLYSEFGLDNVKYLLSDLTFNQDVFQTYIGTLGKSQVPSLNESYNNEIDRIKRNTPVFNYIKSKYLLNNNNIYMNNSTREIIQLCKVIDATYNNNNVIVDKDILEFIGLLKVSGCNTHRYTYISQYLLDSIPKESIDAKLMEFLVLIFDLSGISQFVDVDQLELLASVNRLPRPYPTQQLIVRSLPVLNYLWERKYIFNDRLCFDYAFNDANAKLIDQLYRLNITSRRDDIPIGKYNCTEVLKSIVIHRNVLMDLDFLYIWDTYNLKLLLSWAGKRIDSMVFKDHIFINDDIETMKEFMESYDGSVNRSQKASLIIKHYSNVIRVGQIFEYLVSLVAQSPYHVIHLNSLLYYGKFKEIKWLVDNKCNMILENQDYLWEKVARTNDSGLIDAVCQYSIVVRDQDILSLLVSIRDTTLLKHYYQLLYASRKDTETNQLFKLDMNFVLKNSSNSYSSQQDVISDNDLEYLTELVKEFPPDISDIVKMLGSCIQSKSYECTRFLVAMCKKLNLTPQNLICLNSYPISELLLQVGYINFSNLEQQITSGQYNNYYYYNYTKTNYILDVDYLVELNSKFSSLCNIKE